MHSIGCISERARMMTQFIECICWNGRRVAISIDKIACFTESSQYSTDGQPCIEVVMLSCDLSESYPIRETMDSFKDKLTSVQALAQVPTNQAAQSTDVEVSGKRLHEYMDEVLSNWKRSKKANQ